MARNTTAQAEADAKRQESNSNRFGHEEPVSFAGC
jgi:hypothetical protein